MGIILLGATTCMLGCSAPSTRQVFLKQEAECLEIYCTGTPEQAKAALLNFAAYARDCQKRGVEGIRYDEVLARTYGRLFLLESSDFLHGDDHLGHIESGCKKASEFSATRKAVRDVIEPGMQVAWETR